MKYFATDARTFPDHNIKLKSGQTVELSPEAAAGLNGVYPGILVPYDPAVHTPEPTIVAPVEAPVDALEVSDETPAATSGFVQEAV